MRAVMDLIVACRGAVNASSWAGRNDRSAAALAFARNHCMQSPTASGALLQMSKIVDRTLDFIELFATERRPLSLSDISRLLGIPVSSCHDVLQALLARGYVYEIGPRAGFYPTVRLLNLARPFREHDPILLRAELLLRKSAAPASTSRFRSPRRARTQATYLLVLEPSHPLRFMVKVGDAGAQPARDLGRQGLSWQPDARSNSRTISRPRSWCR